MFGAINEALAKCGHWVVWDTKAPQTSHWSRQLIESTDCQGCVLEKERAQHKHEVEVLRAFTRC